METFFIVVGIATIIAVLVRILKPVLPLVEQLLNVIFFTFLLLFVIAALLITEGYRFYGPYTNSFIAVSFICSAILLHGFSTKGRTRFFTGLVAWPYCWLLTFG